MGNVLTDGNGNVLISSNNALEVTSSIDSNIQAGNIKKDVTILGVTGTYEGSGGGTSGTTFYSCSTANPGTRGSGGGGGTPPGPEPGIRLTLYIQYPNNNDQIPDMFIVYDPTYRFTGNSNILYTILSSTQGLFDSYYQGITGHYITITNLTSTLATLLYSNASASSGDTFDTSNIQFAPIYLNT